MPAPAALRAALAALALLATPLRAEQADPPAPEFHTIASGVSYALIGTWDAARLNQILTEDIPAFSGLPLSYAPARNGILLYRVLYPSVIPEQDNRPITASGLLALPDTGETQLPMVSYQHGTVYGRQEVPSFPEQSTETQLMLAQFAGQGYALIGADYFGMGAIDGPEGYMVKASHQQATQDMLSASRAVLADLDLAAPDLYLAGWSQGGFVTMAMLERLEQAGEPVRAAATASAPVDVFVTLSGFLDFPRPIDADWVTSLFILSAFSFENYYAIPGLARSLFTEETYEIARKAYEREPVDASEVPTDLRDLIRPEYFEPGFFAVSAYGRLAAQTQAYRWVIETPVRNYYGESDEVISIGLGRLAMDYQRAIGAGNPAVEAISTGPTTHRGTFATAVPLWKDWFDAR